MRALDVATKALARRDFSERGLLERLERAGIDASEAASVVGRLRREGVLDDARFGVNRARALAERGKGDTAIRFDLELQGLPGDTVESAIAALEPERARAERIVLCRGSGPATARLLAGRGFDEEAIEAVIASGPRAALG